VNPWRKDGTDFDLDRPEPRARFTIKGMAADTGRRMRATVVRFGPELYEEM